MPVTTTQCYIPFLHKVLGSADPASLNYLTDRAPLLPQRSCSAGWSWPVLEPSLSPDMDITVDDQHIHL